MASKKRIERETSRIAMQFWWARNWPKAVLAAFVVVVLAVASMLAGCTTPGQYAAGIYCGMTDEERQLARERMEAYCGD